CGDVLTACPEEGGAQGSLRVRSGICPHRTRGSRRPGPNPATSTWVPAVAADVYSSRLRGVMIPERLSVRSGMMSRTGEEVLVVDDVTLRIGGSVGQIAARALHGAL